MDRARRWDRGAGAHNPPSHISKMVVSTVCVGGRYWTRTSDLLLVRQALSPTELTAPIPRKFFLARLAGLEPTTSASAGQRSIHLSYKRIFTRNRL